MCTEQCGSTVQSSEVEIVATILGLAVLALFVIAYSKIIAKTGNPWWWIFLGIVPIFNLAMILFLAFRRWPVQKELELTRQALEAATGSPFPPGSQLPRYGKYPMGSGFVSYVPGNPQGYGPDRGYVPHSFDAVPPGQTFGEGYPSQPYGDPGPPPNPYAGYAPQQTDNPYGRQP